MDATKGPKGVAPTWVEGGKEGTKRGTEGARITRQRRLAVGNQLFQVSQYTVVQTTAVSPRKRATSL